MKQFERPMNTVALDLALQTLFTTEGRDKSKVAYDLIVATMENVYATGAASRNEELEKDRKELAEHVVRANKDVQETIKQAERIGYDKGHAAAMFAQAAEKLNAEAAEVHECLAPQTQETTKVNDSETAFLHNAVSALN